ncbi:hypothetical protein [Pedobacter endophyticus]|uniref:Uncharacterized protein n=1 Tax=Pedobacter endophyticus TaxID=2789740 RepID=A0A7S9KZS5_9SPHI|nr:hypothetical protein [Pedobacter endophyticus]QPH39604.1 hypothetical protein IZT61_21610 [Pedobacter endophyticus]
MQKKMLVGYRWLPICFGKLNDETTGIRISKLSKFFMSGVNHANAVGLKVIAFQP